MIFKFLFQPMSSKDDGVCGIVYETTGGANSGTWCALYFVSDTSVLGFDFLKKTPKTTVDHDFA